MSFDPTSEADKAELYTVMTKVGRLEGHRAIAALTLPFPNGWASSEGSLSNLRKRQYDGHRAQIIYDWLIQHRFTEAHATNKRLFPETPDQRFQRFVDEHAVEGKLRIVTADGAGRTSVQAKGRHSTDQGRQEFWFELDVEEDGYPVACPTCATDLKIAPRPERTRRMRGA